MPHHINNFLNTVRFCVFGSALGFSALCHADTDLSEQYFEDLSASLPAGSAATKAVAQTLIQYELYHAYRLADQQLCSTGWTLMGTLIQKHGPDKQAWLTTDNGETIWSFTTRRRLQPWTCAVDPHVYLESVRSHLPEWISIRYLTASEIDAALTLADAR